MNFHGFTFSDLGSVEGIASTHRVAPDIKHAAAMALKSGLDMDLGGNAYGKNLEHALKEGLISSADLDSAVSNVLRLKFEMGLFENPYVNPSLAANSVRNIEHRNLAKEIALQSIVLLKNKNDILPLSKNLRKIAVIGRMPTPVQSAWRLHSATRRKQYNYRARGIRKMVHRPP
jgi:beta-glucosidase